MTLHPLPPLKPRRLLRHPRVLRQKLALSSGNRLTSLLNQLQTVDSFAVYADSLTTMASPSSATCVATGSTYPVSLQSPNHLLPQIRPRTPLFLYLWRQIRMMLLAQPQPPFHPTLLDALNRLHLVDNHPRRHQGLNPRQSPNPSLPPCCQPLGKSCPHIRLSPSR